MEQEFRTEPFALRLENENVTHCPVCDTVLDKIYKLGSSLVKECGYCRYSDRPFCQGSVSLHSHYPEGCKCQYEDKNFLYISCPNCSNPKCVICDIYLGKDFFIFKIEKEPICQKCSDTKKDDIFTLKWAKSSPQEKLKTYGVVKLKILAKNKGIKGYSKYKKIELIKVLEPLVVNSDFPIKET